MREVRVVGGPICKSEVVGASDAVGLVIEGAKVVGDFKIEVLSARGALEGEDDGEPCRGCVGFVLWEDEVHFQDVIITTSSRGRGYGSQGCQEPGRLKAHVDKCEVIVRQERKDL